MRTARNQEDHTRPSLRSLLERKARFVDDERGSLTIFSLFLFVLLLMVAGMAVDMVNHEQRRVTMQNTLDSAILSAASMSQEMDAETLVKDYVAKAGFDPNSVTVTSSDVYSGDGSSLYSRSVAVNAAITSDTMFMDLMGVSSLNSTSHGSAVESSEYVEISLVLDISGSMNEASADASKTKIQALKVAAKEFVRAVLETNDASRVAISIIPYNQQVYVPDAFTSRLMINDSTITVSPVPSFAGALTEYQMSDPHAPCFVFDEGDFETLSLSATGSFNRSSAFLADNYYWALNGQIQQQYQTPYEWARWCGDYYSKILPFSNNKSQLDAYIDGLTATGATAINVGMNWGLGLLDPSFQPIVTDMIASNELTDEMVGRPFNYDAAGSQKFVVLMTDGANTNQFDLKAEFKSGPTRIWYAPSATSGGTNKNAGYFVLMPNKPANQRWYKPGSPLTTADDQYLAQNALPSDAVQLDYHELYQRFGYRSAARFFFQHSDTAAYNAHNAAYEDIGGYGTADTRLGELCSMARVANKAKVFTVAFEAPAAGQEVLEDCAFAAGYYFDVDGTDIASAFQAIAAQIAMLRLTE